jgi:hypothetical protein
MPINYMEKDIQYINSYMPINYMEKDSWRSLITLKDLEFVSNSVIVGDFNIILYNSEKRCGNIVRDLYREKMEELIVEWDLIDIKPIKGKYTWTNRRNDHGNITVR